MQTPEEKDVLNFAENGTPKIPSTLNVLTILTFIGCGITLLSTLAMPYILEFSLKMMNKAASGELELSAKQLEDMQKSRAMIEMTLQNKVPIMIASFIGVALCLWGAIWMRKLKQDGYWIYIAGQIIPIAAGLIIMGKYQFVDWKSAFSYIVPAIFIILYTMQKKYLVK